MIDFPVHNHLDFHVHFIDYWSPPILFQSLFLISTKIVLYSFEVHRIFCFFWQDFIWCAALFMMTNSLDRLAHLFNSSYGTSTINNFPVRKFRIRFLCPIDKFKTWGILLNFRTFCVMSLRFNGAHSVFEHHPKMSHLIFDAKSNI